MSVEDKREQVLSRLYDEMQNLHSLASDEAAKLADIASTLERARESDLNRAQDADLKDIEVIKETQEDKNRRREAIASICVTAVTNVMWALVMTNEMHRTRMFETDGIETSSVSKWLKSSFPKIRMS